MKIDLVLFYNLAGFVLCVFSFLMFAIRKQEGEEGYAFNAAKRYIAFIFILGGLSMFAAQFDTGLESGNFETLNVLMLLFFFLIAQSLILSFLILYASQYVKMKTFKRAMLPVLILFGIYTVAFFWVGDVPVYSARDFLQRLMHEPMLILRCVILVSMILCMLYSMRLCHRAKREYNQLICNYFSETDFSRSVWLSNLLAIGEALSIWVLLTYFYTTPMLEVIVGTLIMVVGAFYVKAFYDYRGRYEQFRPAILMSLQNSEETSIVVEKPEGVLKPDDENKRCGILLEEWKNRGDKPFCKPGLTIGSVAKDLYIPKYRISNYINREQGNFCSWVNGLRIEEAVKLLVENNNYSISEVAEKTGFCDLPAFSRAFKKVKKVSPSEFRNSVGVVNK